MDYAANKRSQRLRKTLNKNLKDYIHKKKEAKKKEERKKKDYPRLNNLYDKILEKHEDKEYDFFNTSNLLLKEQSMILMSSEDLYLYH